MNITAGGQGFGQGRLRIDEDSERDPAGSPLLQGMQIMVAGRNLTASRRGRSRRSRRGATLVLILALLVAIIIAAAFSIEVAYMQLVQTQLRAATDAAARAGGETLSREQDLEQARATAIEVAQRNSVAGSPLRVRESDIQFGNSSAGPGGNWNFTPGGTPTNALRVVGDRSDGSLSGHVPLLFGRLMGKGYFEPVKSSTVAHLDRDICIVVDRSGSMAWDLSGVDWSYPPGLSYPEAYCTEPHPTLSRWAALNTAVAAFNTGVEETLQVERMSLVSYATAGSWCSGSYNAADINQPLTEDYARIESAMTRLSSRPIPGGTNISAGIDLGVQVLTDPARSRPHAFKTMVVLTDGQYNAGRDPLLAAMDAAAKDIVVHAVTFSAGTDIAAMQAVAEAGGGKHYHAPGAAELEQIFREIALTLPVVFVD